MDFEHSDIHSMLETAVVAARLAGQRAMEEIKYVKSALKNDNEIVTEADALCQKIIIDRIKENYPDHGFIAEEGESGGIFKQSPRSSDSIWWIVDPIDGTTNYSHGLISFAVSVGVIYEGRPIVGVIFDPGTESMYTGAVGMEAQLNNSHISVSKEGISRLASFGIDSHFSVGESEGIRSIMERTRFRNLGTTALHLAYVAKGSLVGTVCSTPRLWDIAAGAMIVEAAGGMITDLEGESLFPVDPGEYDGREYGVLASNKATHGELVSLFSG